MDLQKIVGLLEEIKLTSGKNDKIDIIKNNKSDLRELMLFMFDPSFKTNISKAKLGKRVVNAKAIESVKNTIPIIDIYDYITFLNSNSGKDTDILLIQNFILQHDNVTTQGVLQGIAIKNLRLGVGLKEVNKAYGTLIQIIQPMLASSFDKHTDYVDKNEIYVTEKLDGNRVLVKVEEHRIRMYTRNGLELSVNDYPEIAFDAMYLPQGLYDGEMIADVIGSSDEVYKATSKITRSKGVKKGLIYKVFDYIEDDTNRPYHERREQLENMVNQGSFRENGYLQLVPVLYKGMWTEEAMDVYHTLVEGGAEGAMVNTSNGLYGFGKRSKDILKMKKFHTMDLKVIGTEEGEGRNAGKLGAFVVDFKGNEVRVGSGLSDENREDFWRCRTIGKIIEVRYFEVSSNKDGIESLRFPTFVRMREDKKDVSYD